MSRLFRPALLSAFALLVSGGQGAAIGETAGAPARAQLAAIESRVGGRLGVAALDLGTGRQVDLRADDRFPFCSTFKFLLAAAVLSRCDRGKETLGRWLPYGRSDLMSHSPATTAAAGRGGMTVSALCAAAVEESDNGAANLLLRSLGGPPALTRFIRSLGDAETRVDRGEPALNSALPGDPRDTTTPAAMLGDLKAVLVDQRLSPASQALLKSWLSASKTGAKRFRAGLPPGWGVGDKTGTGDLGTSNDIAIFWPPGRQPILCAAYLTGSPAGDQERDAALCQVARIISAAWRISGPDALRHSL